MKSRKIKEREGEKCGRRCISINARAIQVRRKGEKRILALDPGYKSGCKVVCLDENGDLKHNENIYPHPPQRETALHLTVQIIHLTTPSLPLGHPPSPHSTLLPFTKQTLRCTTLYQTNTPLHYPLPNKHSAALPFTKQTLRCTILYQTLRCTTLYPPRPVLFSFSVNVVS